MADVHSIETRSRNMRAIGSRNTKPELYVRSLLHRSGFRFRIEPDYLPSKVDIYLPKYRVAVFVHGCFWHGHDDCHLFRLPNPYRILARKDRLQYRPRREAVGEAA